METTAPVAALPAPAAPPRGGAPRSHGNRASAFDAVLESVHDSRSPQPARTAAKPSGAGDDGRPAEEAGPRRSEKRAAAKGAQPHVAAARLHEQAPRDPQAPAVQHQDCDDAADGPRVTEEPRGGEDLARREVSHDEDAGAASLTGAQPVAGQSVRGPDGPGAGALPVDLLLSIQNAPAADPGTVQVEGHDLQPVGGQVRSTWPGVTTPASLYAAGTGVGAVKGPAAAEAVAEGAGEALTAPGENGVPGATAPDLPETLSQSAEQGSRETVKPLTVTPPAGSEHPKTAARRLVDAALALQAQPAGTGRAASPQAGAQGETAADTAGAPGAAGATGVPAGAQAFVGESADAPRNRAEARAAAAAAPEASTTFVTPTLARDGGQETGTGHNHAASEFWRRAQDGAAAPGHSGPPHASGNEVAAHMGLAFSTPAAQAAPVQAAASTVPTGTPAAGDAEMARQVVRAISLAWHDDVGEARLRLTPEHLGEVTVSVRVERGVVSAVLQAETATARDWMRQHESELRQGLEGQGLRLDELVVTDEGQPRQQHEPSRQRPRTPRARSTEGAPRFQIDV